MEDSTNPPQLPSNCTSPVCSDPAHDDLALHAEWSDESSDCVGDGPHRDAEAQDVQDDQDDLDGQVDDEECQGVQQDLLSFSVLSVDGFTSNIIGNILTISPDNENFNGEVNFTVLVNDGELEDSESFKLFYIPVNDVPQISSISNAVILEDQSFITLIETFDFDNDSIDLSVEISGNASALIDDNLLTVTPNPDFNGMINISVSASVCSNRLSAFS